MCTCRALWLRLSLNCPLSSHSLLQVLPLCGVPEPANREEEKQELSDGGGEGHATEHRGRNSQDGAQDEATNGKDGLSRGSLGLPHQAGGVRERDDLSVLQVRNGGGGI